MIDEAVDKSGTAHRDGVAAAARRDRPAGPAQPDPLSDRHRILYGRRRQNFVRYRYDVFNKDHIRPRCSRRRRACRPAGPTPIRRAPGSISSTSRGPAPLRLLRARQPERSRLDLVRAAGRADPAELRLYRDQRPPDQHQVPVEPGGYDAVGSSAGRTKWWTRAAPAPGVREDACPRAKARSPGSRAHRQRAFAQGPRLFRRAVSRLRGGRDQADRRPCGARSEPADPDREGGGARAARRW